MTTLKSVDSPSSVPNAAGDCHSQLVSLNTEAVAKLSRSVGPILAAILAVAFAGIFSLQFSATLEKTIGTVVIVIVTIIGVIYVRQKNLQ